MNDLQKEIARLQNLRQNKNKDKSILERMAQISLWRKQANIGEKFTETAEKKMAEELFDNYLANYEFTSYNDITNVSDLVFAEITKLKIQQQISEINSDENSKFVPDRLITSLHEVQERIWALKEKAGIVGKKEQDDLTALEDLQKKFKTYIFFNRNEFTLYSPIICQKCGAKDVQPILLRRRVKDFDVLKHPFFSGRFYYNRKGMALVKTGIWTKEQYAWVFETSVKYVDWCLEHENDIIELSDVDQQEINDFINSKEYLKEQKIPENLK